MIKIDNEIKSLGNIAYVIGFFNDLVKRIEDNKDVLCMIIPNETVRLARFCLEVSKELKELSEKK
jgi:hypothetical protein